ncbi:MAG: choice-of-anchor M domain-containing protein [Verrucomicrobiota bacterium]|nr:choice-of-anchor M domain-containing protein [Limisphaera sp.]MDW8382499.1 choice-of-anchor M domain-containing protein [Verrucomicrobiota bacterium]
MTQTQTVMHGILLRAARHARRSQSVLLTSAAGLLAAVSLSGQTWLWHGHADLGVNYQNGVWELHIHHGSLGKFEPEEVVLSVDVIAASNTVPTGAVWSFLGSAGSPVWILPQNHDPNLLFLGLGAEELGTGVFTGDQVMLTLESVQGPGQFALYETDPFGTPQLFMNSGDGVDGNDRIPLTAGQHRHAHWAFTAPGSYQLSFVASGTLAAGGGFLASAPVAFRFEVAPVPEPGLAALLSVGAALWFWLRNRAAAGPDNGRCLGTQGSVTRLHPIQSAGIQIGPRPTCMEGPL